ncbi:T cell receptor alpha chain constant isoform X2 [Desmodus rotundus]|uniref:T cell receptor alpha chain constant isoform X2 n=1 Tax=Desmodus rotundus TaxID=9430 RepID=UPI0039E3F9E5
MDKILGAFLILWLQLGWVSGQQKGKSDQQQVKQSPESLVLREKEISILNYVKNPDPAVYQPRSPKSSRTSICLFTDFDSNTDVPQATGSSAFGSNSTVLDMRSTHSKSYGALLWSDSTDFGCKGTFNKTFYPSSEFSCDVTSVEKSFETDINLNFQNLSVIGFRILLLKVAGFNLLMTLRLWSS